MKKFVLFIILLTFLLFVPSIKVEADMGPKSTVSINIVGVNEDFFIDLLFQRDLPNEQYRDERYEEGNYFYPEQKIPLLLKDYSEDGFISSILYRGRPTVPSLKTQNLVKYSYVPPKTFKIIIIFDDDTFITSKPITTKLFNSNVTWDLSNIDLSISQTNVGTLEESIPYTQMGLDLITRIVLTVLIELVVLFLFRYKRRRSYSVALITNIVTQTILTIFMFQMRYFTAPFFGEVFALIVGEVLILIIESITYRRLLTEHSKKRAQVYTFVANFASVALGFVLMFINFMNSIK